MHPTYSLLQRHSDEVLEGRCTFFDSPDDSAFKSISRYDLRYHSDSKLSISEQPYLLSALNILFYPKAKERLFWWLTQLAPLLTTGKRLWVIGENDSGIKSLPKKLKGIANVEKIDSARHCALFEVALYDAAISSNPWQSYTVDTLSIHTLPGVFSANKLDVGSRELLPFLHNLTGIVLEMGCGAGVLSAYLLSNNAETTLCTYDVDLLAVRSTIKTLEANQLSGRASVHWAASLDHIPEQQYDVVVTNPPFHKGVKTSYAESEAFFTHVSSVLKPRGKLIWVANDFLNYQDALTPFFTSVTELQSKNGFKVFEARK